jgi:hypothetical protein
MGKRKFIS